MFTREVAKGDLSSPCVTLAVLGGLLLAITSAASAQDMQLCFDAADRAKGGDALDNAEKKKAHEACLRALSDTSSIVQKYQLQEADFDITATRPKQ